ncbi:acyl carrier protein [Ligilactobacillus murinus]|uniref:acyl carrier protein n=1 Tax=Ligilactobacillus murinus TaxID=1622 RepID=UPI001298390E|nr:acyl carrier protein [Ligilactobacillus murinus]
MEKIFYVDDEILSECLVHAKKSDIDNISELDMDNVIQVVTILFKMVLKLDFIDKDSELFEYGDSIQAMKLMNLIEKYLGLNVTISDIFLNPSAKTLASFLLNKKDNFYIASVCNFLLNEGGK